MVQIPTAYFGFRSGLRAGCSLMLGFALTLLVAENADAAVHCVRAGASGAATGENWADALPNLPTTMVRSETYLVADGDYDGKRFDTPENGGALISVIKATAAEHGPEAGWSDTYGDGVALFVGQIRFDTSNWVFDGAVGGGPESWTNGFGFKVDQQAARAALNVGAVDNISIKHVEVVGNDGADQGGGSLANDGLAVYGGTRVSLSYYYIHDMGRTIFFLSTQDFIAEYGYTGDFTSSGATHAEIASIWNFAIPIKRVTFRYNFFSHIEGTGGLMVESTGNDGALTMAVYGNVFYRDMSDDWNQANGVIGGWTADEFRNVHVYNNSFININQNTLSWFPQTHGGNVAKNNLWYASEPQFLPTFAEHDYNHFIDSGTTEEPHGTVASGIDPFVDLLGRDLRLISATPAGEALPAPYDRDLYGRIRGQDGSWDRGAMEFGVSNRVPTAPSALTVE